MRTETMIRYVLMCLFLVGMDLSFKECFDTGEAIEGTDPLCKVNCSCCVDQSCGFKQKFYYFNNDSCLNGCIDGYRGARCYIKCSEHCKACPVESNICTTCHDGFYNGEYANCSESCASKCKSCKKSNDLCTKWHDGFYLGNSRDCSEKCPANCKGCKSKENCTQCNEGYYNGNEFDFERSDFLNNCTHQCRGTCTRCVSYNNCTVCVDGNFGAVCEQECSGGCVDNSCQQSTGNCLCKDNFRGQRCAQCIVGMFGTFCDRKCPLNCKNATCDKVSGNCSLGCIADKFTGPKCNDCAAEKYGTFCNKSCQPNCKGGKCNKMRGVCLHGCKENFAGETCSACVAGKYSLNCDVNCSSNCENQSCEITSGNCLNCNDHYFGNKCDKCKIGYCGYECNDQCPPNCLYGVCDRETGSCLAGCTDGFSGNKCCLNNSYCTECSSTTNCSRCVSGYYSQNCTRPCPCGGGSCEITNGRCVTEKATDIGHDCSQLTNTGMILGFSITIGLLLIIIAILVIIVVKRSTSCQRHRMQQNQAGDQVINNVEMAQISVTDTKRVEGCDLTPSSMTTYQDLLPDKTDAGQIHQYLEIQIGNEDFTGEAHLYENQPQDNDMKSKLCKK